MAARPIVPFTVAQNVAEHVWHDLLLTHDSVIPTSVPTQKQFRITRDLNSACLDERYLLLQLK